MATDDNSRPPIQGFDETGSNTDTSREWQQTSDRRVRVGIAGYGFCRFGAAFHFQDHPNVEVVAVTDALPDRRAALAKDCRCETVYPTFEEMVGDDRVEAVFVATDAPRHARHSILALQRGKHVACAVPAVFGALDDADRLFEAVKKSGLNYMMLETSVFHDEVYAARQLYEAGELGDLIYCEGEYYHYKDGPLPSYQDWRVGLPPMWYPTHSTAYYVGIHGGRFTEVACLGKPSIIGHLKPAGNKYNNPFGTEIALFRTEENGMARMAVSWDTPGHGGERGRIRGTKGSIEQAFSGESTVNVKKPPLPPGVDPGGHGGSHGYLMHEFILSIIENRHPLVDITWALNMTAAGIVAHQSALRGGEWMKVPEYDL